MSPDHDGLGEVRLHQPVVYQEIAGQRQAVAGRYVLHAQAPSPLAKTEDQGDGIQFGFEVAAYDRSRPLVIDPVLVYSTYLRGSGHDRGYGIAMNQEGRAYVTGVTDSTDFPTEEALQPTSLGEGDAFVAKFNARGTVLVYSTYLGGSGSEYVYGIAVDGEDQAYMTGQTDSTNLPTEEALRPTSGGSIDAFITQIRD